MSVLERESVCSQHDRSVPARSSLSITVSIVWATSSGRSVTAESPTALGILAANRTTRTRKQAQKHRARRRLRRARRRAKRLVACVSLCVFGRSGNIASVAPSFLLLYVLVYLLSIAKVHKAQLLKDGGRWGVLHAGTSFLAHAPLFAFPALVLSSSICTPVKSSCSLVFYTGAFCFLLAHMCTRTTSMFVIVEHYVAQPLAE